MEQLTVAVEVQYCSYPFRENRTMPRGSFATMQTKTNTTQVMFYYENGQTETLSLPITATEFSQQLPQLLSQPWLTFHLIDQTVIIATAKLLKIEVKPSLVQLEGEGIYPNVERVTALQRGAAGRLSMKQ
jgi:hypothetical protein